MRLVLLQLLTISLLGCIGTSPEQERRQSLGPFDDGDEFHRPGQPCLACHSSGFNPGEEEFVVAGTIYLGASDEDGLGGVEVLLVDADGRSFSAETNRVGNFMIEPADQTRRRDDGRAEVAFEPRFPLTVTIRSGDREQRMRSKIWRDGSCGSCHTRNPEQDTVEQVWLLESM